MAESQGTRLKVRAHGWESGHLAETSCGPSLGRFRQLNLWLGCGDWVWADSSVSYSIWPKWSTWGSGRFHFIIDFSIFSHSFCDQKIQLTFKINSLRVLCRILVCWYFEQGKCIKNFLDWASRVAQCKLHASRARETHEAIHNWHIAVWVWERLGRPGCPIAL
jgi:hypothetical protein